jgi:hypothetical protein
MPRLRAFEVHFDKYEQLQPATVGFAPVLLIEKQE